MTIFIGGNHEASNYLQELPYGGWVAPNIYYLGYAGCIQYKGIRIGGLSGIYKDFDYFKGHFEMPPYTASSMRSVYHYRELEIFRLQQLSSHQQSIDVMMSHDWPSNVYYYGDADELIRSKPRFGDQIRDNILGSPPLFELLKKLQPKYWFSAHLHCKFAAIIPHYVATANRTTAKTLSCETKFLGLSKCLPEQQFLQILDMDEPKPECTELQYDLEWLTILSTTKHLTHVKPVPISMPHSDGDATDATIRWNYRPSNDEKNLILNRLNGDLTIPNNFKQTAPSYCPWRESRTNYQPKAIKNPQTIEFCERLGIDDPLNLVTMLASGGEINHMDYRDAGLPVPKNMKKYECEAAMVNPKENDFNLSGDDDENDDDKSITASGVCNPMDKDDVSQSKEKDAISSELPFEILSIVETCPNCDELVSPISKEI